jgi:hypothetical protein
MGNNIKSLVENLLGEEVGMLGINSVKPEFTQADTGVETVDQVDEKSNMEVFVITNNGEQVWEGPAKDKRDAINRAIAELGEEQDKVTSGTVVVTMKKEIKENSELSLSPKSFRTLYNCFIAESMINETVEIDETLEKNGLITEGKLTPAGKNYLKMYLPTIFAS